MKLYVTPTSPFARITRIMVIEKGFVDRVDIVRAQTRAAESPYYKINLSGRIPYLIREDGVGMEDSALICSYLDNLDGNRQFEPPAGNEVWEYKQLEARARSLLDGLAVWRRELHRPEDERSPTIIAHENERSRRMIDYWEKEVLHSLLSGELNMVQVTLICALQMEDLIPQFDWRSDHPNLCAWEAELAKQPSIMQTAPTQSG